MPGSTPSWFCRFPNAHVNNNNNNKFWPNVAGSKFYNHKHNEMQNLNEYTQAEPIL